MEKLPAHVQQGQKRQHEDSQVPGPSQSHLSQGNIFGGPAKIGSLTRSLSPEHEIALKKAKTELSNYDVDVEIFVIDDLTRPYALNAEKKLSTMGLNVRVIDVDETMIKLALDKAKNNLVKFIIVVSKMHKNLKTADLHVFKTKGQFKFPDLSLDSILTYFNITYQTSLEPKLKSDWIWREGVKTPLKQHNPPKGNKTPIHPKLISPINDLGVRNMELGKREKEPERTNWHQLGPSPSLFHKELPNGDKKKLNDPKILPICSKGKREKEPEQTNRHQLGQTPSLFHKELRNSDKEKLNNPKILPISSKGKREKEPEQTNRHQLGQTPSSLKKDPQKSDKEELYSPKMQSISSKGDQMVEIETLIQMETAMRGQTKVLEFLKAQNCSFGLMVEKWKIKTFEESKILNGTTLCLLIPDSDIKIIQEKLNGKLSIGTKHYFFKTTKGLLVQPVIPHKLTNRDNRRNIKMIKKGVLPPKHMSLNNRLPK